MSKRIVAAVGVVLVAGFLAWITMSASCQEAQRTPPDIMEKVALVPELEKYVLHLGWWRIGPLPDQPCLLAVSPDGQKFHLPNDFQAIVRREHLSISSPETALNVASTYAELTSPYKVLVISDYHMIPGIDRNPIPSGIGSMISAPVVQPSGNIYLVRFFTWKEIGGVVEEWTFAVSENGTMQVHEDELTKQVGDALGFG